MRKSVNYQSGYNSAKSAKVKSTLQLFPYVMFHGVFIQGKLRLACGLWIWGGGGTPNQHLFWPEGMA